MHGQHTAHNVREMREVSLHVMRLQIHRDSRGWTFRVSVERPPQKFSSLSKNRRGGAHRNVKKKNRKKLCQENPSFSLSLPRAGRVHTTSFLSLTLAWPSLAIDPLLLAPMPTFYL